MYVVKPFSVGMELNMNHPEIFEVPQEKLKLFQLGIEDRQQVVFVPMDDG
jgi:hypothetical protein